MGGGLKRRSHQQFVNAEEAKRETLYDYQYMSSTFIFTRFHVVSMRLARMLIRGFPD